MPARNAGLPPGAADDACSGSGRDGQNRSKCEENTRVGRCVAACVRQSSVVGMNDSSPHAGRTSDDGLVGRAHKISVVVLQVVMAGELVFLLLTKQWLNIFLVLTIMLVTLLPVVLRRLRAIDIPPEFQVLAVTFVFASLFLGEVRSYYERFWWWDVALHVTSGLLLGILGFLLVYLLNENERVELHMRPRFVALFSFVFAVAVGCLWEIFEFGVDRTFDVHMQKPMLGDPSGLTDTMWDLIVDAFGALAISVLAWWYMERGKRSFVEAWTRKFIERNPQLFKS